MCIRDSRSAAPGRARGERRCGTWCRRRRQPRAPAIGSARRRSRADAGTSGEREPLPPRAFARTSRGGFGPRGGTAPGRRPDPSPDVRASARRGGMRGRPSRVAPARRRVRDGTSRRTTRSRRTEEILCMVVCQYVQAWCRDIGLSSRLPRGIHDKHSLSPRAPIHVTCRTPCRATPRRTGTGTDRI